MYATTVEDALHGGFEDLIEFEKSVAGVFSPRKLR